MIKRAAISGKLEELVHHPMQASQKHFLSLIVSRLVANTGASGAWPVF